MKKSKCRFQRLLLKMVKQKLNLMLCELAQLKNPNFEDQEELVQVILKKIANGKIKSAHINSIEAKQYLKLFNEMYVHQKVELNYKNSNEKDQLEKPFNPFKESPFN